MCRGCLRWYIARHLVAFLITWMNCVAGLNRSTVEMRRTVGRHRSVNVCIISVASISSSQTGPTPGPLWRDQRDASVRRNGAVSSRCCIVVFGHGPGSDIAIASKALFKAFEVPWVLSECCILLIRIGPLILWKRQQRLSKWDCVTEVVD